MLGISALAIAYALWAIFVISWSVFDRRVAGDVARPAVHRERLYGLVLALGLTLIVLAPLRPVAPKLPSNAPPGDVAVHLAMAAQIWVNPFLDWAMLVVIVAGIAWCWWARLHLGRLWSSTVTRKEEHRIVGTGPYRLVRHPIYTGFIVIYVGMAIICATVLALVAVPVMTLGLWFKTRLEERFLIEELGAVAYGAYKARTPMLVPRMPVRPG
jgi:protein-S-isoprenylcysteine O-methyltransferase Ste14